MLVVVVAEDGGWWVADGGCGFWIVGLGSWVVGCFVTVAQTVSLLVRIVDLSGPHLQRLY